MDDFIYRQAAIDAIRDLESSDDFGFNNGLICAMNRIAELPPAEPQPWIPVTERLPETDEEVLVYLRGDLPHLAWVDEAGQWETDRFYLDKSNLPKAWMPLPEPWKGESKEAEDANSSRNLCDSCTNNGCIFQSGIVRNYCDFYNAIAVRNKIMVLPPAEPEPIKLHIDYALTEEEIKNLKQILRTGEGWQQLIKEITNYAADKGLIGRDT